MILDGLLLFTQGSTPPGGSTAYADTITATGNSTNTIDLGPGPTNTALPPSQTSPNTQPFRDIGIGDDPALKLLIMCLTTFTTGTGPFTVALQGAPDNGSGAPGAFTTWWSSPAYATATLVQGARLYDMDMPRPPAGVGLARFLRLSYTNGGTAFATAFLLGAIVVDRHDQVYNSTNNAILGGYPAGITVAN
jgi:hypothetical protein